MYLDKYYPTTNLRVNIVGQASQVKMLQQQWICALTGKQEWRDIRTVFNAPYVEVEESTEKEYNDQVDL